MFVPTSLVGTRRGALVSDNPESTGQSGGSGRDVRAFPALSDALVCASRHALRILCAGRKIQSSILIGLMGFSAFVLAVFDCT